MKQEWTVKTIEKKYGTNGWTNSDENVQEKLKRVVSVHSILDARRLH